MGPVQSKDELFALVARAADAGVFNAWRENLDILKMASIVATYESARFYAQAMLRAQAFDARADLLRAAVARAPGAGLILEFGVGAGTSLRVLAEATPRVIAGFDSFQGLPEDWRTGFAKGAFAQVRPPAELGAHVRLVEGLFEATLPGFLAANPGPVALLHVDCDLYSSTVTVLRALAPRIAPGTVIVFDEYFNFPGWQEGEHKAFTEFAGDRPADYWGFVRAGSQVAVTMG